MDPWHFDCCHSPVVQFGTWHGSFMPGERLKEKDWSSPIFNSRSLSLQGVILSLAKPKYSSATQLLSLFMFQAASTLNTWASSILWSCRRLPKSSYSHSPMLSDYCTPFSQFCCSIAMSRSQWQLTKVVWVYCKKRVRQQFLPAITDSWDKQTLLEQ